MVYTFGPFAFNVSAGRLLRDGVAVPTSPRPLQLLSYLIARPRHLVTKEELFKAIWRDKDVADSALTRAVSDLRGALGDDSSTPEYIQTVQSLGYRFVATVTMEEPGRSAQVTTSYRPRETSSMDALRLATEGRVRLESLDSAEVPAAIVNFQQAIALDPSYAPAYIGLANAYFWQFERTRFRTDADRSLLALAIEQARNAQRVDGLFPETHATLAYLLTAAEQWDEARCAARRAVTLEPDAWMHHFRLAHAAWGNERLQALRRCKELYAEFSFAYFQSAMVHIARQHWPMAEQDLQRGSAVQDAHATRRLRFPASGLHWLLGCLRLQQGEPAEAAREFQSELESARGQLYASEFTLAARTALGFARLALNEPQAAVVEFRAAVELYAAARPQLGLALALRAVGKKAEETQAIALAVHHIEALERGGRKADAALSRAGLDIVRGRPAAALNVLKTLLGSAPAGPAGWSLPIDPLFASLHAEPQFGDLLALLAERAR